MMPITQINASSSTLSLFLQVKGQRIPWFQILLHRDCCFYLRPKVCQRWKTYFKSRLHEPKGVFLLACDFMKLNGILTIKSLDCRNYLLHCSFFLLIFPFSEINLSIVFAAHFNNHLHSTPSQFILYYQWVFG